MTRLAKRPAARPIDRAAHAICERVATFGNRCACKASGGPACSAMQQTAEQVLKRFVHPADWPLLDEVIRGTADLRVVSP